MREMRSRGKFETVRLGEGKSESGRSKTGQPKNEHGGGGNPQL